MPDHARREDRVHSRLHSLVLMCPGSSSLGMASLQRGHFPNPSLLSHSVSRCSVRLEISTTWAQERRQGDFCGAVQGPQTRAALLGLWSLPSGCVHTLCRDPVSFCSHHVVPHKGHGGRGVRGGGTAVDWTMRCGSGFKFRLPSISCNVHINRIVPPVQHSVGIPST